MPRFATYHSAPSFSCKRAGHASCSGSSTPDPNVMLSPMHTSVFFALAFGAVLESLECDELDFVLASLLAVDDELLGCWLQAVKLTAMSMAPIANTTSVVVPMRVLLLKGFMWPLYDRWPPLTNGVLFFSRCLATHANVILNAELFQVNGDYGV